MRNFILCLIAVLSVISTASGQTEDSVKLATNEVRPLLRAWENEPRYIFVTDSLRRIIERNNVTISNDSTLISDAGQLLKSKNETIKAQSKLSEDLTGRLGKADDRLKWWQAGALGAFVAAVVEFVIITVKGV